MIYVNHFDKLNNLNCMKVAGEIFTLKKEETPKRQDTKSIETFRQKGLLPDRTLESFFKNTNGAIPKF